MELVSLGTTPIANSNGVLFPFFLAELKSDGPCGDGSLWVATNRCLSGSATCLNILSRLNIPESIVFSLAMSGTEGRLYVSWKEGPKFLMLKIADFMLQRPKEHIELQQNIKNILDWGREERLCHVQESLKAAALRATAKPSSSRKRQRMSSASDSVQLSFNAENRLISDSNCCL
ncbi:hypothetical protein V8E54_006457 [Elaphomyces granulatus]